MEARAVGRYLRVTPRKAQAVVALIRGKKAGEALHILKFVPRHASKIVAKILQSAISNAKQKDIGDLDDLWISSVDVGGGPTLKRVRARSMGRANIIKKRTCHIAVTLRGEKSA